MMTKPPQSTDLSPFQLTLGVLILDLAVAHRLVLVESVRLLGPLGPAKGDGVGDLIKGLVLGFRDKEENEDDGGA